MTVIPSGELHRVDVEDLFFSTTDRKGVILLANHIFASYARRDYDELVGAPHNIIRHPSMPAGAFRIVWRMLEEGHPTCAYVLNLAGDGSAYWAFATLVPIGDHYISVRSSPCQKEVKEPLQEAYARVRTAEMEAREAGRTAAQAAEIGEAKLLEELAELGFGSYEDFLRVVVPAEVAARQLLSKGIPSPDGASGVVRSLNAHAISIHRQVTSLGSDLASFESTAHRLTGDAEASVVSVRALAETLQQTVTTIEALADRAPLLATATPALRDQCGRVAERLASLAERVAALRDGRSELRFSVALAQMQTEMIGRYTVAVLNGDEAADITDTAIQELVAAVDEGLTSVNEDLTRNTTQSREMSEDVDAAGSQLRLMSMSLAKWRSLVDKYDLAGQLQDELGRLDESLATVTRNLESLSADAERFASGAVRFDATALTEELDKVKSLAGYTGTATGRPERVRDAVRVVNLQPGTSHLERLLRS